MYPTQTRHQKIRLFFNIFIPILVYQFANFSTYFIDTTMTGQSSTLELAGVSIATNLWSPFFSFLTGLLSALVPIVGQHLGKQDDKRVASDFYQFLYLALGLSLFLFVFIYGLAPVILTNIGLELSVVAISRRYLIYLSLGIIPLMIFSVIRSLFDALGLTRLSMYLMILLVPLNAGFNYLFINGKLGFPKLGGAGTGLGTSLAYWILLLVAVVLVLRHPKLSSYNLWRRHPLHSDELWEALKLGLPIGGAIFAEVSIFSVVAILMAKFSSLIIASHQAAMNFSTLMYAFPLSISIAMAIMVSYEVGAKRWQDVHDYTKIGRLMSGIFFLFTFVFLFTFRYQVAQFYGRDQAFIQLTTTFLTYSLFFQMADSFAAPLQGILRGYKDTAVPFLIGVLSYWGVTIPVALCLDYKTQLGPYAYWIGLILSLVVSGFLYEWRLRVIRKRQELNE